MFKVQIETINGRYHTIGEFPSKELAILDAQDIYDLGYNTRIRDNNKLVETFSDESPYDPDEE